MSCFAVKVYLCFNKILHILHIHFFISFTCRVSTVYNENNAYFAPIVSHLAIPFKVKIKILFG